MFRGQKTPGPVLHVLFLTVLFLFNLFLFGGQTAKAIICIVPHSDAYRKASGIPANVCKDAATAYAAGGGKKTAKECPGPTPGSGVCGATSLDVIWQYTGFTSLNPPSIEGYVIYVRTDPTKDVLTSTSCYLPTTPPALPAPLTKADFDPWFGAGPMSEALCNVDSVTAGWKTAGADPAIAISGEDPKPQANFLMMTLNFTSLKDGGTIFFDYDAGEPAVSHSSGAKNVAGCTDATFNTTACKCPKTAEATDGCYEMDVTTGIVMNNTCPVTGPAITWGATTGCPAAGTAVPTVTFTAATCKPPSGACGGVACSGACNYTVKSGGASIGTGTTTSIALPAVAAGTAVSYTVEALCGDPFEGTNPTVSSTAPSCDQAPTISASSIKVDGKAPGSSVEYSAGVAFDITGTVADADDALNTGKITLYYGLSTGSGMTAVTCSVDSSGNFKCTVPGSATLNLNGANFKWGITTQDKDGTGSCFDGAGNAAGAAALCAYYPSSPAFVLKDMNTAVTISNSQFVERKGYLWVVEPTPNHYPLRPGPNQAVLISFALPEESAVTMYIYTLQGQLLRVLANTEQDPTGGVCMADYCPPRSVINGCKWDKGCVWDGTSYEGVGHYVSNGMYITVIHANSKGTKYPGATLEHTRGIVIQK